jgi:hypothetical protein
MPVRYQKLYVITLTQEGVRFYVYEPTYRHEILPTQSSGISNLALLGVVMNRC